MVTSNAPAGSVRVSYGEDAAAMADLLARAPAEVPGYLTSRSGLPGPRANLPLADLFAASVPAGLIWSLADSSDEYLAFRGTEGLGRLALTAPDRTAALTALRRAAADERWQVREGAARALQLVGDADPALMHTVVADWSAATDPCLARAAVAAICQPRLMADTDAQALALPVCDRATALLLGGEPLAAEPMRARKAHRVLRQALGYGWSAAIAASPEAGLIAFRGLTARDDPDARCPLGRAIEPRQGPGADGARRAEPLGDIRLSPRPSPGRAEAHRPESHALRCTARLTANHPSARP
ncbi:HEAT repeat domain-containing protein [Cryobacterium adonitolivorans]|uniref:HEAT repeat domain-containing protein n=1 Tax=Cryobacterium adonitolivorans TaxID=1259189 RepID=A0A4R8W530_9MICO|nr:HEAT repeat domain-containing protein [Cryobacterium adonitolivorans]TFC02696.1 HEAT repeat domain-containing protein [Cryobacterium adonitolivorans]